ncbi:hypothetical protein PISMIDRAFT_17246 [Pisolithus microcarpus 441]|uniref:Uncharacterized protein n=1 Tax=Pisolithus microcarpus 441 TaxID=765257 RepID=A0A0C9XQL7_9AGAM|nr:hypothetical protein BKA83DRAFT_17246 [Pisolithus microcarpus]KIK14510.1 hypothetical protein PISMIDRAFT_17246 [Pisolithus microcarpus 441]
MSMKLILRQKSNSSIPPEDIVQAMAKRRLETVEDAHHHIGRRKHAQAPNEGSPSHSSDLPCSAPDGKVSRLAVRISIILTFTLDIPPDTPDLHHPTNEYDDVHAPDLSDSAHDDEDIRAPDLHDPTLDDETYARSS